MSISEEKTYSAVLTTSKGIIRVVLDAEETPETTNNFVTLARSGFYDDTVFHRIMEGFMIQGGDPNGDGTGGPGYTFDDEPIAKEYTRGTIAMANRGPNTNGSQFFIMHQDYPLPKQYVIFGSIVSQDDESLTTLDAIATTPVGTNAQGEQSVPQESVILKTVEIIEE